MRSEQVPEVEFAVQNKSRKIPNQTKPKLGKKKICDDQIG